MTHSMPSGGNADAEHFERVGLDAAPGAVARAREEFAGWLKRFFALDEIRSSDLVLATNEALSNAAEFAYLRADRPGTMDVKADYDARDERLTVRVSDRGVWRVANASPRSRGRGIPLMRALSDRATIETSGAGTQVCLEWRGVPQS